MQDTQPPPSGPPDPDAPAPHPLSRAARREIAARDALRSLLRDHYLYHFGAGTAESGPFDLNLRLRVDPSAAWDVAFDPPFPEQIHGQLEDFEAERNVFTPGRVYCFRCKSSQCSHAAPPDDVAVFHGYTSTGTPDWRALVQHFIDAGDERVDTLYARPPALLARVQLGRELKQEQLSVFGRASRTYAILGQVVAGYFSIRTGPNTGAAAPRPCAVTFQFVETRDAEGRPTLAMNTIPAAVNMDQWDEFVVSDRKTALYAAVRKAHHDVEQLSRLVTDLRAQRNGDELRRKMRSIPRLLTHLARGIEAGGRRDSRRTHHAHQRHAEERPVHKALDDALGARSDCFYYDLKRDTFVVCGERGRAHVFNAEGKHVTSFVLRGGAAEFRVRTNRWRQLAPDEYQALRRALSVMTGNGQQRFQIMNSSI